MIREFARAKINFTVDVLKNRADGFHEVEMIMQSLELADVIELEKISDGINFKMDAKEIFGGEKIPVDEKNLAYRAILELEKVCGENFSVAVNLKKKIPAAAGLGGGSSDAAAVLRGMNKLFDLNFSDEELCKIGANIGSDIPFCVIGGTCLAKGRGELLIKLPDMKKFSVVLMKPRGEISTAWSYKTFDELPEEKIFHPPTEEIISLFACGEYETAFSKLSNVLEPVALKKFPAIEIYKQKMIQAGAKISLMTGSGPTVFAITDDELAEKVAASVKDFDAQIFITKIF